MEKKACIVGMLVLMAGGTLAAEVAWGTARNSTGEMDVSLDGISEWAYSLGSTATFSLNGQTFIGENAFAGNADLTMGYDRVLNEFTGSVAPFTSLTRDYQGVLASAAYASSGDGTIMLNGLAVGQQYEVQLWINDSRDRKDWGKRVSIVGGTAITIDHNVAGAHGGLGQHIIGCFTADAATQTFELISSSRQLNAIQLRSMRATTTLGFIM